MSSDNMNFDTENQTVETSSIEPKMGAWDFITQAWSDLRTSDGWLTRCLLLSLIMLVPILNFVTFGYVLRWGARAAFEKDNKQPAEIFGNRHFIIGFYSVVVSFIVSLIFGIISSNNSFFMIFVANALFVLFAGAINIALLYMTMLDNLGAAFRVKRIARVSLRNFGGLFAVTWFPVVISVVFFILLIAISSASSIPFLFALMSGKGALGFVLLNIIFVVAIMLLGAYLSMVLFYSCSMISLRATAYWIKHYAPEWVDEAEKMGMTPQD